MESYFNLTALTLIPTSNKSTVSHFPLAISKKGGNLHLMKMSFTLCLLAVTAHVHAKDIAFLKASDSIGDNSAHTLSYQTYPGKSWSKDGQTLSLAANDLKLWGKPVKRLSITDKDAYSDIFTVHIVDEKSAAKLKMEEFKKQAGTWKKLVDEQVGSKGKNMGVYRDGDEARIRIAWQQSKSVLILSLEATSSQPKALTLSAYSKKTGIAYLKSKGKTPAKVVKTKKEPESRESKTTSSGFDNFDGMSESKIKSAIKAKIREINKRRAPEGVSSSVQGAINLLNVYRYLCKVPYDVVATPELVDKSKDAAKACDKANKLSHALGHSTDACNLAMSTGKLTLESSLVQYMDDAGPGNRAHRGHRTWCLNHRMGKTGFAKSGNYAAMYAFDQSGSSTDKNYSYPGHGYFPIDYLHGNGWTYYFVGRKAPAKPKVQVWYLGRSETELPEWGTEPNGKKLPVNYINVDNRTVIFEPQRDRVSKKGSYLVRVSGDGAQEQYLVHLF